MPPVSVITPALLSSIRGQPHLPSHAWYFLAGVTLSVLNMLHEIPNVFKYAIEKGAGSCDMKPGHKEQLEIARKMREALLKAAPIGGLPKAINALFSLKSVTPSSLLDEPLGYSPSARPSDLYNIPQSAVLHRGQRFFDQVYGKVSKRVMSQMDRSGTEDLGITARLMYGYILSNTNILTARETSFVLVAGLIPQDVPAQLKGHIKGCLNHGASIEEVKAVRGIVIKICEASGMRQFDDTVLGGWGWRRPVADL